AMAVRLVIPPCGEMPKHQHHLPPEATSLRVSIGASRAEVQRLIPNLFPPPSVDEDVSDEDFYDQNPGVEFAKLVFAELFGRAPSEQTPGDFVFRQAAFGGDGNMITDYDITFDHLVPDREDSPEVLQLNTFSLAQLKYSKIPLDQYATEGNVILLPRCCQTRIGSTDRGRVNDMVRLARQSYDEESVEDIQWRAQFSGSPCSAEGSTVLGQTALGFNLSPRGQPADA
ncbi:hypothetical protein C8A05DRAFT_17173, partial [Staphylotrichum tortipilum]